MHSVVEAFETTAYNHCRGSGDQFLPSLQGLAQHGARAAKLLQSFVEGPTSSAPGIFAEIRDLLYIGYGDWHFNINEPLWHITLMRKAHIFVHRRSAVCVVSQRQALWKESSYGDGGLTGLGLFYLRGTRQTLTWHHGPPQRKPPFATCRKARSAASPAHAPA